MYIPFIFLGLLVLYVFYMIRNLFNKVKQKFFPPIFLSFRFWFGITNTAFYRIFSLLLKTKTMVHFNLYWAPNWEREIGISYWDLRLANVWSKTVPLAHWLISCDFSDLYEMVSWNTLFMRKWVSDKVLLEIIWVNEKLPNKYILWVDTLWMYNITVSNVYIKYVIFIAFKNNYYQHSYRIYEVL